MQLQMEVWCLDECDFLETRFKTYEMKKRLKDGTFKKPMVNIKELYYNFMTVMNLFINIHRFKLQKEISKMVR